MKKKHTVFLVFGFVIFILDQLSKSYIDKTIQIYQIKSIIPGFLRITKTYNKGVVFGFLNGMNNPIISNIITIISVSALIILIYLFLKSNTSFIAELSMTMIVAGAIGNIFDRIVRGRVVDFIEVYYKRFSWPVFNIADSFISIGVVLLILCELRRKDASDTN